MVEVKKVVKYLLIVLIIVLFLPTLLGILFDVIYPPYPIPRPDFDLKNVSVINSSDGDKITLTVYRLGDDPDKTLPISSLWAEIMVGLDGGCGVAKMLYDGDSSPLKKISNRTPFKIRKWGGVDDEGVKTGTCDVVEKVEYYNITPFEIIGKTLGPTDVLDSGDILVIHADDLFEKGDVVWITIVFDSDSRKYGLYDANVVAQ